MPKNKNSPHYKHVNGNVPENAGGMATAIFLLCQKNPAQGG